MRIVAGLMLLFLCLTATAQKKAAWVSGKVVDENDNPLSSVSVTILGSNARGTVTSDSGTFRLKVQADKPFALIFSYAGYNDKQ